MYIENKNESPIPGTLSICMIVKNEEKLLGRCLQSIKEVADELVVVDTGSTDSTVKVAEDFGANVIRAQWKNDFAWARNISIKQATCQWILWLDADDVVPSESIPMIKELKSRTPDRVYALVVRNERPGNTGTEFMQARMFPNRSDILFERSIHEQMMPSALRIGMKLENQNVVIEHHGYADPDILKRKAKRNVEMLLKEHELTGGDAVMQVEIADSFLLIEDFDAAERWYKSVISIPGCIEVNPAIASEAFNGIGTIELKREQFKTASDYFESSLNLSPWRLDVYYNRAVALEMTGDIKKAMECLQQIIVTEPKPGQVGVDFRTAKIKAFLRMLRILVESGDMAMAELTVQQATTSFPNRPEIHNMVGKCFLKSRKYMDALHEFEKSLNIIKDGNIEAYIGLCFIYCVAEKQDLAKQTICSIEQLFRENEKYHIFRKFLFNEGSPEKTDSSFEQQLDQLRKEFFYVF